MATDKCPFSRRLDRLGRAELAPLRRARQDDLSAHRRFHPRGAFSYALSPTAR